MCTLAVAAGIVPGLPLVVVANRDEERGRPSRPPFRWDVGAGKIGVVAPRDERAGGTWLGYNDDGVFVGITNRFGANKADARGRALSRGRIVVDALEGSSAAMVHRAMASLDPKDYPGFHLVYADEHDVFATISDGRDLVQLSLGAGLTVVTERSFGAGWEERAHRDPIDRPGRVRRAWEAILASGPFEPSRLTRLLTEHDAEPFAATCVHYDSFDYGTRSALVLAVPPRGAPQGPTMLWAEGPPCTTPFFDVTTNVPSDAKRG